ncbi:hypothetical protein [Acidithrix ferrooxidans]|uniref:Transposase n=1 Tax=Acidithrix ferrooxidans TaxID=1280514 RepID=A0A0D8HNF0_9ACTN|nr:hypothetical protein [Acidithrix ferrooxidans]KJF18651.1 hypothetical protein AXFE_04370 [Acidithrix ferrooxidans]
MTTSLAGSDNSEPAKAGAIARIAKDHGINANVVYQWNSERKARVINSSESIDKIKAVIETSSMNEHELGSWLRSNGVLAVDLEEWRNTLESAFDNKSAANRAHQAELDKERKARVRIEAELRRKEKALAEAAALLVLQKKVRETELVMIHGGRRGRLVSPLCI